MDLIFKEFLSFLFTLRVDTYLGVFEAWLIVSIMRNFSITGFKNLSDWNRKSLVKSCVPCSFLNLNQNNYYKVSSSCMLFDEAVGRPFLPHLIFSILLCDWNWTILQFSCSERWVNWANLGLRKPSIVSADQTFEHQLERQFHTQIQWKINNDKASEILSALDRDLFPPFGIQNAQPGFWIKHCSNPMNEMPDDGDHMNYATLPK